VSNNLCECTKNIYIGHSFVGLCINNQIKVELSTDNYIKMFTFLSQEEIDILLLTHKEKPEIKFLQKTLAEHVTRFVHKDKVQDCIKISNCLFYSGDIATLTEAQLESLTKSIPVIFLDTTSVSGIEVLAKSQIFTGKNEIKRLISQRGISVNGVKIDDIDFKFNCNLALHGRYFLCSKGRKDKFIIKITK